jgi:hypothetical protein
LAPSRASTRMSGRRAHAPYVIATPRPSCSRTSLRVCSGTRTTAAIKGRSRRASSCVDAHTAAALIAIVTGLSMIRCVPSGSACVRQGGRWPRTSSSAASRWPSGVGGSGLWARTSRARGAVPLQQDATIYSAVLDAGQHVVHALRPGRIAWLHVVRGAVRLDELSLLVGGRRWRDGRALRRRDGYVGQRGAARRRRRRRPRRRARHGECVERSTGRPSPRTERRLAAGVVELRLAGRELLARHTCPGVEARARVATGRRQRARRGVARGEGCTRRRLGRRDRGLRREHCATRHLVPTFRSPLRVSLGLAPAGRVGPARPTMSMPSPARLASGHDSFAPAAPFMHRLLA